MAKLTSPEIAERNLRQAFDDDYYSDLRRKIRFTLGERYDNTPGGLSTSLSGESPRRHRHPDVAGLPQWTWLADLPAALAALWLSHAWQLRRCLAVRLLAVLHIALAWLGAGLGLHAAHALLLLTGAGSLGLAPLHALTLGFFASAVIGMVTRVTLGHSGRPLNADDATWLMFWGMQGVAVLRVVAEFVRLPSAASLSFLAALGWLAVFGASYARFAPVYLQRRPDGQTG